MATNAAAMLAGNDNPADEAVEYGNSAQTNTNKKASEFFSVLLQAAVVAHILHLQARSFAEHMALDTLYSELPGLTDSLIESYQGKYGLVMDYPPKPPMPAATNCVAFVTGLNKYIDDVRLEVSDDSEHQNAIDEIVTLLNSTTYKLKFLS
jgi:Family of unknown function (DUF5856)